MFPFENIESDRQYRTLNKNTILQLLHMYDMDVNIRAVTSLKMESLLNGDILFTRKSAKLSENAKRWFSSTFKAWLLEVVRCQWALGFVVVSFVDDDVFERKPVVIPPEIVILKYRVGCRGEFDWKVYVPPGMYGNDSMEPKLLSNAEVWVVPSEGPTPMGQLRSKVQVLNADHLFEMHAMQCMITADLSRAEPCMVTEYEVPRYDQSIGAVPTKNATDVISHTGLQPYAYTGGNMQDYIRTSTLHENMRLMNSMDAIQQTALNSAMRNVLKRKAQAMEGENQVYLEQGRKLVQQKMAEGPDYLMDLRAQRQERVFQTFGVPMAMVTNSAAGSGSSGGGGMAKGNNSNSQLIFLNAQKQLKLELLSMMRRMYKRMYTLSSIVDFVTSRPKKAPLPSIAEIEDDIEVDIQMPGIPDEQAVIEFWKMGMMKYEATCQYLSAKHGISEDAWNTKPELTLKEINGVKEETAASKPKPKSKS